MYWSNYHSHSIFCDGRSPMEDFVKFAIAKGFKKFGFSSHAPLPFDTFWNMKRQDEADYLQEFDRLKSKYRMQIELFIGLEVDYIDGITNFDNALFSAEKFDYLIGSVHFMDRLSEDKLWCVDGNFNDFEQGLQQLFDGDIHAAIERYFQLYSEMIHKHKGEFQLLGHIDKIALNAIHCNEFNKNDKWYTNLVGEVMTKIKAAGLILEINTKSVQSEGITYPDEQFFGLIKALNIPITVNSDCHYPYLVADGFQSTYQKLYHEGFRFLHQIINNQWEPVEFNKNGLLE